MDQSEIRIIKDKISGAELRLFLGHPFEEMIKFVVDVEREIVAIGGEMHADAEQILLENGSRQINVWGGNIYPGAEEDKKIEYIALINVRPSENNRSMEIQDGALRKKIRTVLDKLIEWRSEPE